MAIGSRNDASLNTLWMDAYAGRRTTPGLFQFVWSLTPRLRENRSLKGDLLVATRTGLLVRSPLEPMGPGEMAVAITDHIGVADILSALPMPLESEALEFAHFLARFHADNKLEPPANIRAQAEGALRDFLRVVERKAKVQRRTRH